MTDPKDKLDEDVERLREDAAAMKRPDREIPLPKEEGEDEGVGPITGAVP